jgi:hypothetical protein
MDDAPTAAARRGMAVLAFIAFILVVNYLYSSELARTGADKICEVTDVVVVCVHCRLSTKADFSL